MKPKYISKIGKSPSAVIKRRIQALVRQIAIIRDGGCILRDAGVGNCSTTLQGEHLITRQNSATFGDMRNIVCLCSTHHIFWKPQHSRRYWELIEERIGKKRWSWLKLAEADHSTHKPDWKIVEIVLQNEFEAIKKEIFFNV